MSNGIELMLPYAPFVHKINQKVFRGGLRLNAVENPNDISTIVTVQDKAISRLFLVDGIDGYRGVQHERPGSFSEEMDSQWRLTEFEIDEEDPIDGTGDLKFSADSGKPYGATNLVSRLVRNSDDEPYRPVAGMIFDFIDEMVILGDSTAVGLYRVDGENFVPIRYKLQSSEYRSGEPIRIGRRDAYPHQAYDEFLKFLRDEKKLDLVVVRIGGAGRAAEQLFRTNMKPEGDVPSDYEDTAIDVFFNYQPDHKTWDLDPTLAMYRALGITQPTDVYGRQLTANAAAPQLKPGAWHTNGYLYSARGPTLHKLMAQCARDFEREVSYKVIDAKITR
ncbi:MAG: hypothetical protein HYW24_03925 [Candidatus Aenigmarchaeota archaeon]|nr:hypothetical protein [Candidatus Aenigmarchaeota archaeon]